MRKKFKGLLGLSVVIWLFLISLPIFADCIGPNATAGVCATDAEGNPTINIGNGNLLKPNGELLTHVGNGDYVDNNGNMTVRTGDGSYLNTKNGDTVTKLGDGQYQHSDGSITNTPFDEGN